MLVFQHFKTPLILTMEIFMKKYVKRKHFGCSTKPGRQCKNYKNDDRAWNYCHKINNSQELLAYIRLSV